MVAEIRRIKTAGIVVFLAVISAALVFALHSFGCINFVLPDKNKTILGIDVSHHQGFIDWAKVKHEKIGFAYIKATEGDGFTDPNFFKNMQNAQKAGILTGAYHYFRFDEDGAAQAKHFIKNVPVSEDTLPPAVDVEFTGNSERYDTKKVDAELKVFIEIIEKHYGRHPLIYVLYDSYGKFVAGRFTKCPVWIRDTFFVPCLPDKRQYLFWQYSEHGKISGITEAVDMDAFAGSPEDLSRLTDTSGQS